MSKLSLLDKLGILIELSQNYQNYLIVLLVLLIFGIVLSFTNKRNEKIHKILYFGMTIVIIVILVVSYHSSLGKMISYMMNHFFVAIYFPNIAIYIAAIIAMNIIVWISIFSFKSSKQIRLLNVSVYIIMNYLMALLLKIINTNTLDIFDQQSLYGNKQATALIELSSLVFVVWVIFLILYKIILIYIKKDYKPKVKRIIVRKKVKKLPENFEPKTVPEMVHGNAPHRETLVIDTSKKTEEEILLEHFSKQFTLEDYKLFSKLLKEQQEREFLSTTSVEISSEKSIEEINEREAQKQEIIRMEEERRELLKQEQLRQEEERRKLEAEKEEVEELKKELRIKELQQKEDERERRAAERKEEETRRLEQQQIEEENRRKDEERQQELIKIEQERKELEAERKRIQVEKERQEDKLESLLQQTTEEKEKEQRKLSELEMLYE